MNSNEMDEDRSAIRSTVYAFGSPCDTFYGRLVFRSDGTITGYAHPNERRWALENGVLTFFNEAAAPTSRFRRDDRSGCWSGTVAGSKWPLVLVPVLRLERAGAPKVPHPPVLINSIPKSGTYYLESVFAQLGWEPTRLHLGSRGVVDDFRGLPDALVHSAPERCRINCPVECLAAILNPGDIVVGHIATLADVDVLRAVGVFDIAMIRNLRNVLVSMFQFKLDKVVPTSPGDALWRKADPRDRFVSFLAFHSDKDLDFVKTVARSILADPRAFRVRFEDMLAGAPGGPHLEPGAILVFDEYFNYPGSRAHEYRACAEFLAQTRRRIDWLVYSGERAMGRLV
jgi:hypothetical protein